VTQRGFTLLETVVALGITSSVVLGVAGAVLHATHASAQLARRDGLADDALNVLSDLRVATAYDAAALARLAGRTYVSTVVRDGRTLTVAVDVTRGGAGAPIVASATVTDATGATATESEPLDVAAPAPGSPVEQPSP
jgi:prepilin-type N-terminal cleavage/methylation domain-containing protein